MMVPPVIPLEFRTVKPGVATVPGRLMLATSLPPMAVIGGGAIAASSVAGFGTRAGSARRVTSSATSLDSAFAAGFSLELLFDDSFLSAFSAGRSVFAEVLGVTGAITVSVVATGGAGVELAAGVVVGCVAGVVG